MSVTLARSVRRDLHTGDPLPDVYSSLAKEGIRIRRGNLHMLAGQTGSMKTMFVVDMIKRMGVPTLYFSNDSDELTVASRMIANKVQRSTSAVAEELIKARSWASSLLDVASHIQWSFNPAPTLDDIDLEMEAFLELYGDYPHLVVVDILDNVAYYEDNDHGATGRILQFLHTLARSTGSAVLVVHHCTEAVSGHPCPPRSAILQKQNKLPVLEVTVATDGYSFWLAAVKNRHGSQDPSGRTAIALRVQPDTCTFWEEVQ